LEIADPKKTSKKIDDAGGGNFAGSEQLVTSY
jgi:hypothetical protein